MMKPSEKQQDSQGRSSQDVVALVDDLLAKAAESGASDIHFEPSSRELLVRFRLDGVLNTVEKLPKAISDNVIARLKVLAGLLTYRNDIPQEGRIDTSIGSSNGLLDRRIAVFPTINGQRAVVRMLYRNERLSDIDRLGLPESVLNALKDIASGTQGVLLLTGPAGSGKSTTLGAILRHILDKYPGRSVVTLEDPVEIRIDGATQVPITPHGQMTFHTALRSLLRQDPEVLMIGEIRDAETARIAVEAGLTGHLMMSTMHSGTCGGTLLRLLEMGVEPYQVTSSISAIVNQRLIRRLCEHCRKPSVSGGCEAVGCDMCLNTGFKGRILLAEMVTLDSELRKAILEKVDLDRLQVILKEKGHRGLAQAGAKLVTDGLMTESELSKAGAVTDR